MNEVFLCLGGNIGNREANLQLAILKITDTCGQLINSSSIYETEAWGSNSSLKYLNKVILIKTNLTPLKLLEALSHIEKNLGRIRMQNQNTDRTIDIDILFFNNELIDLPSLQVPHPRLHLRNFVLKPLAEINGEYFHPLIKKNIKQLLLECTDNLAISLFKKK